MRGIPLRSTALLLLLVAGSLLAGPGLASGTITGTVKYQGRAPNLPPIKIDGDPQCVEKHPGPVPNERVVLGKGDTLANVFVYVKSGLPDKTWPAPADPAVIDQKGCVYVPHAVGLMVGQKLEVLNSDGILHNVHSMSKVNPPFNRAMPGAIKQSTFTFDQPEGMFRLKCDVHPWMSAFVGVFSHPFFSITGTDGKYTIEGLPPGTYQLEAWHELDNFPTQTFEVTISGDQTQTHDLTFQGPE